MLKMFKVLEMFLRLKKKKKKKKSKTGEEFEKDFGFRFQE